MPKEVPSPARVHVDTVDRYPLVFPAACCRTVEGPLPATSQGCSGLMPALTRAATPASLAPWGR
jgi:hypothetical protein